MRFDEGGWLLGQVTSDQTPAELAAMAASFVTAITVQAISGYDATAPSGICFAVVMLWTVGVTTVVWLAVTFLTRPESDATLAAFYRRVRPGGPGWRRVADGLGYGGDTIPGGALSWLNWVAGLVAVFTTLYGTGQILLGSTLRGVLGIAVAAGALGLIARNLRADKSFAEAGVDSSPGSS